ncbi:hypothetical protein C8F01DRAFT_1083458 [Mycena amicta]|nr:hypothetical protein C8F01DRAFT_1083458 [Mycena amicta]
MQIATTAKVIELKLRWLIFGLEGAAAVVIDHDSAQCREDCRTGKDQAKGDNHSIDEQPRDAFRRASQRSSTPRYVRRERRKWMVCGGLISASATAETCVLGRRPLPAVVKRQFPRSRELTGVVASKHSNTFWFFFQFMDHGCQLPGVLRKFIVFFEKRATCSAEARLRLATFYPSRSDLPIIISAKYSASHHSAIYMHTNA